MSIASFDRMRAEALARLRNQYLTIVTTPSRALDPSILNRGIQPVSFCYRSATEYLREVFSIAAALSEFALDLGLITDEQAQAVVQELFAQHRELKMGDFEPVLTSVLSKRSPHDLPQTLEELSQRALQSVEKSYEHSAQVHAMHVRQSAELPPGAQHHESWAAYDRESGSTAAALSSYAVYVGLISPEQVRAMLWRAAQPHPEMPADSAAPPENAD